MPCHKSLTLALVKNWKKVLFRENRGQAQSKPEEAAKWQSDTYMKHVHYNNNMCSRTFKTVIKNNRKSKQINSNIQLDRKAFTKRLRHKHTLTLTAKLNVNVSKVAYWSAYCGKENW